MMSAGTLRSTSATKGKKNADPRRDRLKIAHPLCISEGDTITAQGGKKNRSDGIPSVSALMVSTTEKHQKNHKSALQNFLMLKNRHLCDAKCMRPMK
jgi:hypothetical protein